MQLRPKRKAAMLPPTQPAARPSRNGSGATKRQKLLAQQTAQAQKAQQKVAAVQARQLERERARKQKLAAKKAKSPKARQSRPQHQLTCPHTGQPVYLITVTADQVQQARRTRKQPLAPSRTFLVTLSSPTVRQQVYDETCFALEDLEMQRLPTYGGRSWKVIVKLSVPSSSKSGATTTAAAASASPYFCWMPDSEGHLELACWPHYLAILNSQPEPRWPGYQYIDGKWRRRRELTEEAELRLVGHEIDSNNDVDSAYDDDVDWAHIARLQHDRPVVHGLCELALHYRHVVPVPTISYKWTSPLKQTFTSRTAAYAHAQQLCQDEIMLDKTLHGFSHLGKRLPWKIPSRKATLAAGKLRFVRDGLWVVGQEEDWRQDDTHAISTTTDAAPEQQVEAAKQRALTPYTFFVQSHRREHQKRRLAQLEQFAAMNVPSNPVTENESIAATATVDANNDQKPAALGTAPSLYDSLSSSLKPAPAATPVTPSPVKRKVAFTLRQAEQELRQMWNEMSTDERSLWQNRLRQHEAAEHAASTMAVAATSDGMQIECLGRVTPSSDGTSPRTSVNGDAVTPGTVSPDMVGKHTHCSVGVPAISENVQRAPTEASKRASSLQQHGPSSMWKLTAEQVRLCYDAGIEHYDQIMRTVQSRDLSRELQDGFDLLRERGRGRYDMELPAFDTPAFHFLTDIQKAPWMPVVREILGKDVVLIHKGMFLSMPGAETQAYHQDGPHLTTQYQKPCHAVNVFIPSVNLTSKNGPTEFCLGSHILDREDYDKEFVTTPLVKAGTPVVFDYRLGHKGLANSSGACRPIVYCTYAAAADGKEFKDSVNFSRKRYHRIGDLVEKAPTRNERVKNRAKIVEEQQL